LASCARSRFSTVQVRRSAPSRPDEGTSVTVSGMHLREKTRQQCSDRCTSRELFFGPTVVKRKKNERKRGMEGKSALVLHCVHADLLTSSVVAVDGRSAPNNREHQAAPHGAPTPVRRKAAEGWMSNGRTKNVQPTYGESQHRAAALSRVCGLYSQGVNGQRARCASHCPSPCTGSADIRGQQTSRVQCVAVCG